MNKFLLLAILFFGYSNVYASCYDKALSDEDNLANCMVEAKKGYSETQYILGVMYANGIGVTQDYKETVKWFRQAAEQGQTTNRHFSLSCTRRLKTSTSQNAIAEVCLP